MTAIDVNVLVGAGPQQIPRDAYTWDATVHELRSHAISAAVVSARSGAAYRHEIGNDEVLQRVGRVDGVQLYGVATLNPVQYLDWPAELERALSGGAIAVRLFPDVQKWSVNSEAFRVVAKAVRGKRPLLVPVSAYGDASAIGAATEELEGPVVLLGGHYTQLADCLAAMRRWPHLYLDTSRLAQFRGVETVVREVGAERLLFGSGAPSRPIQAALNAVLTADISEAERALILQENAAKLFGMELPSGNVRLVATRADGLIDVHAHVGALGFPTPSLAGREFPIQMRRHGIRRSIASSLRAIVDDAEAGNAEALEAAQATNGDVLAYVVVNPNDIDGSCTAMDAAFQRDTVVGAKVHCSWSRQPTAGTACVTLLHEIARRGKPLKIHVDGPNWAPALAEVARAHPDWRVIVAHAGPGMASRECIQVLMETKNVYVELSTSFADLPVVRDVVRAAGRGRLLFGSDAPLLEPAYVQGIYADSGADLSATAGVAKEVFGL